MKTQRAQISVEVTLVVGFMFLMFIVFFVAIGNRMVDVKKEQNQQILEDMALYIKNEVVMAAYSENGYIRKFEIPEKLSGYGYSAELYEATEELGHAELVLKYDDMAYEHIEVLPINVTGCIGNGKNEARKINGLVYMKKEGDC